MSSTHKSTNKWATPQRFPRTARVNEVLREVIAANLELRAQDDDRLSLVTVTGVKVEPDLRHAVVYFSALDTESSLEEVVAALSKMRISLQRSIAREVRLKRTPQLEFLPDPAILEGGRVDELLRELGPINNETIYDAEAYEPGQDGSDRNQLSAEDSNRD